MKIQHLNESYLPGLACTAQQLRAQLHREICTAEGGKASTLDGILPPELAVHVARCADPATARALRATNTFWFDAVRQGKPDLFVQPAIYSILDARGQLTPQKAAGVFLKNKCLLIEEDEARNAQRAIRSALRCSAIPERRAAADILALHTRLQHLHISDIAPFQCSEIEQPIRYTLAPTLLSAHFSGVDAWTTSMTTNARRGEHTRVPLLSQLFAGRAANLQSMVVTEFTLPDPRSSASQKPLFSHPLRSLALSVVAGQHEWDALLHSNFASLTRLDLTFALLREMPADALLDNLFSLSAACHKQLERLSLVAESWSNNFFSEYFAAPVLQHVWTSLRILKLQKCDFDQEDESVFFSDGQFPLLQEITFREVMFVKDPLFLLAQRRNTSLQTLSLSACEVVAYTENPDHTYDKFGIGLRGLRQLDINPVAASKRHLGMWFRLVRHNLGSLVLGLHAGDDSKEALQQLLRALWYVGMPKLRRIQLQAPASPQPGRVLSRLTGIEEQIWALPRLPKLEQVHVLG